MIGIHPNGISIKGNSQLDTIKMLIAISNLKNIFTLFWYEQMQKIVFFYCLVVFFEIEKGHCPVVPIYKVSRLMKMDWLLKNILLPSDYKDQINELDVPQDQ